MDIYLSVFRFSPQPPIQSISNFVSVLLRTQRSAVLTAKVFVWASWAQTGFKRGGIQFCVTLCCALDVSPLSLCNTTLFFQTKASLFEHMHPRSQCIHFLYFSVTGNFAFLDLPNAGKQSAPINRNILNRLCIISFKVTVTVLPWSKNCVYLCLCGKGYVCWGLQGSMALTEITFSLSHLIYCQNWTSETHETLLNFTDTIKLYDICTHRNAVSLALTLMAYQ